MNAKRNSALSCICLLSVAAVFLPLAIRPVLTLAQAGKPAPPQAAKQIPRLANGKPDFSGVWDHPNVGNLSNSSNVCGGYSQAAGLDLSRPGCKQIGTGEPLPYNEAGLAAKKAAADFEQGEHCWPWGFVHLYGTPFPHAYVHSAERLVVLWEQDNAFMMVPTDGRELPKNLADLDPTWRGTSAGHWEGDTLVMETAGFNGKAWLSGKEVNSDQLKVTQRMSYIDADHIQDEFTFNDPKYYTKPFKNTRIFHRMEKGQELYEYFCNENNRCENGNCKAADIQK